MTKVNSQVPAFPISGFSTWNGQGLEQIYAPGMTLRDYFAAKAMEAFLRNQMPHETDDIYQSWAQDAYKMADAMLAARSQG